MTSSSNRDLLESLSKEEAGRLMDSMKDPTFATLFADYVKEISDPKARQESEMYLQELEQQQSLPEGMKLLKPSPLFCMKVTHPDHGKLFVNVCTSDLIDRPSSVQGDGGVTWNLPYTCSTPRSITLSTNHTQTVAVVDVTFHASITTMMADHRIRQLVENSALEGGEKVTGRTFNRPYRILTNVKCKDGPPAIMRIGGTDQPNWNMTSLANVSLPQPTEPDPDSLDMANDDPIGPGHDELAKNPVPRYEIIHQGEFQLQNCTVATPFVTSTRPKSILVKIYLPEVDSLSDWSGVELHAREQRLTFEIAALYSPLDIKLPYKVDHDSGRAKFSSSDRVLSVTFPVIQKEPIVKYQA